MARVRHKMWVTQRNEKKNERRTNKEKEKKRVTETCKAYELLKY